uniref:Uncharacterized protein n=1 Tax=Pseudictyota dubia TaxID=2749911 RepID=A0A7R9ZAR1_9STRA|mmetsp:Transcript_37279/g.69003  ORF Transcript_37279/g.69003 Transcript_37279/m.69003 type:complete len:128 (+) Transcript_37279:238-621(+)
MCPPLSAAAPSYRPDVTCQTLRLPIETAKSSVPQIMATSALHHDHDSSSLGWPSSSAESVERRRRLPSKFVAATLPEAPKRRIDVPKRCADITELYGKCSHHEVATAGGVACRSVIMEYLECTAGTR